MSNQVHVVQFSVSVCMRLQLVYPFYQRAFPNECDTGIGIRFTAMPPLPHLCFFRLRHIVPLFSAGKFPVGIKEKPTLIYNRFRDLAAEGNIRTRDKVGEQRLGKNVTIQKRFITECYPDPFRIGRVKCWQRCLQRTPCTIHFFLDTRNRIGTQ